jgi:hypothetical protein
MAVSPPRPSEERERFPADFAETAKVNAKFSACKLSLLDLLNRFKKKNTQTATQTFEIPVITEIPEMIFI